MSSLRKKDILLEVYAQIKDIFGVDVNNPPPELRGWLKGGINTEAMMKIKEDLEGADHRTQE